MIPTPARSILRTTAVSLVVFFWLMVPLSFVSYTSMGLGRDRPGARMVIHEYFRIRWPGNGSILVGDGVEYLLAPDEDVDWIDFAFRMLQPPQRPVPQSLANRLGFWRFSVDARDGMMVWKRSRWIGVPSVLPPLVLSLPWLWQAWPRRAGHPAG